MRFFQRGSWVVIVVDGAGDFGDEREGLGEVNPGGVMKNYHQREIPAGREHDTRVTVCVVNPAVFVRHARSLRYARLDQRANFVVAHGVKHLAAFAGGVDA